VEGGEVKHGYTEPGEYDVHLMATGLNGLRAEDHFLLRISGHMPTIFDPQSIKRYPPARGSLPSAVGISEAVPTGGR
jgi:alpha-galactosidase